MFTLTGPKSKELKQYISKVLGSISSDQQVALDYLYTYEPKREKEKPPQRLQSYLKPLLSHRKGVIGKTASFVLWKYFQALSSHLMPVITKTEERLSDLRWDANHSLHHVELLTEQVMILKAMQKKDKQELIKLKKQVAELQQQ